MATATAPRSTAATDPFDRYLELHMRQGELLRELRDNSRELQAMGLPFAIGPAPSSIPAPAARSQPQPRVHQPEPEIEETEAEGEEPQGTAAPAKRATTGTPPKRTSAAAPPAQTRRKAEPKAEGKMEGSPRAARKETTTTRSRSGRS